MLIQVMGIQVEKGGILLFRLYALGLLIPLGGLDLFSIPVSFYIYYLSEGETHLLSTQIPEQDQTGNNQNSNHRSSYYSRVDTTPTCSWFLITLDCRALRACPRFVSFISSLGGGTGGDLPRSKNTILIRCTITRW